ncbi:MAG: hypothetical protein WC721_18710 [Victivallaceae bacterium]|jgi:transposase
MSKLKYDESFPAQAEEYASKGMRDIQIARELGISRDTFYDYLRKYPEFADAVAHGRQYADDKVEESGIWRMLGYCRAATVKDVRGHEIKTERQLPPDVSAIIRWLERHKHYADCQEDPAEAEPDSSADGGKYDAKFLEDAERYAAEGYPDLVIAGRLRIVSSTFYRYRKQYPVFNAALERGKRECYGRIRQKLLDLALGRCPVITDVSRDGSLRKTTERQLPPNVKAIRYWLESLASPAVQQLSELSESGGCPSGDAGRMGKTAPAQGLSELSESGGCSSGDAGRMGKTAPVQGLSELSESGGCPSGDAGRMGKTAPAQGLSELSESGGCPSGDADRMGKTAPAQGLSELSECGRLSGLSCPPHGRGTIAGKDFDKRFAGMSRKERQRLLKIRRQML